MSSEEEILVLLASAKLNLGLLMYSITLKQKNGESVVNLLLQARVLSSSILTLSRYEELTLEEKNDLTDLFVNYDELTTKNC
jgi:hypothetical protein